MKTAPCAIWVCVTDTELVLILRECLRMGIYLLQMLFRGSNKGTGSWPPCLDCGIGGCWLRAVTAALQVTANISGVSKSRDLTLQVELRRRRP